MHDVPENLLYSKDHEWIEIDGDIGTIGISDHAQAELSDVVFVDLPEVGATVAAGDPVAVVESARPGMRMMFMLLKGGPGTVRELSAFCALAGPGRCGTGARRRPGKRP